MLFQKKEKILPAVMDGEAIPLSAVPDEAFASGMLGVGFGIQPTSGTVYCPADGKIVGITETRHAYTVLTDDGLDLLIHVGIDTVKLGGEGFISMVVEGERVTAGSVIARADLELISSRGYPTVTVVLITNPDQLFKSSFTFGKVLGGKSEVMRYRHQ